MTSRRVHWFDVDVVGTMSIPSPGLDNVTAQAAVADDDDDDDDFALHPYVDGSTWYGTAYSSGHM